MFLSVHWVRRPEIVYFALYVLPRLPCRLRLPSKTVALAELAAALRLPSKTVALAELAAARQSQRGAIPRARGRQLAWMHRANV